MSNFITITRNDTAATHAQRLLNLIQQQRAAINDGAQLMAEAYQMFGDGSDKFNIFAQKFGCSVEDAQTVFDILNGTQLAMRGKDLNANAIDLTTRIG